ncbi:MAG: hypothetical protein ACJAVR_002288 [Paracoccaceae bacterium]|jgi:hypothetical protein
MPDRCSTATLPAQKNHIAGHAIMLGAAMSASGMVTCFEVHLK